MPLRAVRGCRRAAGRGRAPWLPSVAGPTASRSSGMGGVVMAASGPSRRVGRAASARRRAARQPRGRRCLPQPTRLGPPHRRLGRTRAGLTRPVIWAPSRSIGRTAATSAARRAELRGVVDDLDSAGWLPGRGAAGSLGGRLEQQHRAGHGGIERADLAAHRDAHGQVDAPTDVPRDAPTLAAHDERERPPQVRVAEGERRGLIRTDDPQAASMQVGRGRPPGRPAAPSGGAPRRRRMP